MVLVIVLKVVGFFEHLVVRVRGGLNVGDQAFVLEVQLPVLFEVVLLLTILGLLVHKRVREF